MKKFLVVIAILVVSLFLFKGWLFRLCVSYQDLGGRPTVKLTDLTLKAELDQLEPVTDLEGLVEAADDITTDQLYFVFRKAPHNPNQLMQAKAANCIGYSAMFNTIANYLIRKNNLEDRFEAKHRIGKLYLFGINLHRFFSSSFFKDHDYNEVKDLSTQQTFAIDPSISDYLRIGRVSKRNP